MRDLHGNSTNTSAVSRLHEWETTFLPARYLTLCGELGISKDTAASTAKELGDHYTEPHRYYHNTRHLAHMLGTLDAVAPGDRTLEMAVWFHDVIYDPKAGANERRSAEFFEFHLGGELPASLRAEVTRLILATDYTRPRSGLGDEDLLRDIDLSILAAKPEIYRDYSEAIRREYDHVPIQDFIHGRLAVLRDFLHAPVFHTAWFTADECRARENIAREIDELSALE